MKQEDMNTLVNKCLDDFNFDCILNFFKTFGDINNPKFLIEVPEGVSVSVTWWDKPLTKDLLVKTARDLLIGFIEDYDGDLKFPFDLRRSHGGFHVEATEVDDNNKIKAVSLQWCPLYGEGSLSEK